MTCREFADFMADYLSGELPAAVRSAFDYHLTLCVNCRRYLTSYEETVNLGKRAFDHESETLPPEQGAKLPQALTVLPVWRQGMAPVAQNRRTAIHAACASVAQSADHARAAWRRL